jgi:hypothetical protein
MDILINRIMSLVDGVYYRPKESKMELKFDNIDSLIHAIDEIRNTLNDHDKTVLDGIKVTIDTINLKISFHHN